MGQDEARRYGFGMSREAHIAFVTIYLTILLLVAGFGVLRLAAALPFRAPLWNRPTAAVMRDRSELPNGRAIQGRVNLFIGGADMPIDPPANWQPTSLLRKLEAGAQFVQTQFCMDAQVLRRYMAALSDHGIPGRVFILIGIAPLASARSARWIRDKLFGSIIPEPLIARLESAADPKVEGHRICLELMREYADIAGVAGVHLMAPLNESAVPSVISDFRTVATASAK